MSSANSTPTPFTDDAIILSLNFHKPGMQKSVKKGTIDIGSGNIAESRLRLSKFIFKSEELQEIKRFFDRVLYYVTTKALPVSTMKDGMHMILNEDILDVIKQLEAFVPELDPLIQNLRTAYPGIKAGAKQELGDLYDDADFPDFDVVAQSISFDWDIPDLFDAHTKLGQLSFERLEQEKKKLETQTARMRDELRVALRFKLQDLLEKLSKDLAPGKKGKVKKVSQSKIDKYVDDLGVILSRNIIADEDIKRLATRCRTLLTTGGEDDLNLNDKYRMIVSVGVEKLINEMKQPAKEEANAA